MLKRTLCFTSPLQLSLKNAQMVIKFKDIPDETRTVPYMRFCASLEAKEVHVKRVRSFMPAKGRLSIIAITDKQYSGIINIWGEIEQKVQKRPMQLELF